MKIVERARVVSAQADDHDPRMGTMGTVEFMGWGNPNERRAIGKLELHMDSTQARKLFASSEGKTYLVTIEDEGL